MTAAIPRVDVLGVHVSATTMAEATRTILGWVTASEHQYVCVTGVHGVMESHRDATLRQIHNSSGLTAPDGMPLRWCSRVAGIEDVERVYGPDLMIEVMQEGTASEVRHFLLGSDPGTLSRLESRLSARIPGLVIAGTLSPPFREPTADDVAAQARAIDEADADIVWVGLGTPRQERWMAAARPIARAAVLVGVGAAFDFHAGTKRQAPRWMQRSGLEWLFRLASEPRRLGPRYLRNNPEFLARIAIQRPRVVEGRPQ